MKHQAFGAGQGSLIETASPAPAGSWQLRFLSAFPVFALITILNFLGFLGAAVYLGGEAMGGKVEGDRYFLCRVRSRGTPKEFTEVTSGQFTYSRWHQGTVLISWPLMMAGALVNNRLRRRAG